MCVLIHCIYLWKSLASICCERDLELMLPTHRAHFWGGALRCGGGENTRAVHLTSTFFFSHIHHLCSSMYTYYYTVHCLSSRLRQHPGRDLEAAVVVGGRVRVGRGDGGGRTLFPATATSCQARERSSKLSVLTTRISTKQYQDTYIYTVMYTVQCSGHIL